MDLNRGPLYHVLRDPTLGPVDVDFQYLSERTGGFAETQRLGRGGFGDVYRGMSRCGDFFAVKRISQHLLGGLPEARAAAQRSYEREIVALSRFSHPQIVRLVAYSAQSGERALVYEFLPGGSLADALEDDQRAAQLTWKARTCVLRQVACALHFMHRGGAGEMCFHRDVKSANICLTATLSAKLIDCGLAMFIAADDERARRSRVTGTGGGVLGTPAYMSPEYGRTGKCSEKAEVFSFGIVVLEVLTGKLQMACDIDLYSLYNLHAVGADSLQVEELDERCGRALVEAPELAEGLCALARGCLVYSPEGRIDLTEVLQQLTLLWVKHCAPTVEGGLLSAAREEVESLRQALMLKTAAAAEEACVCVLCMGSYPLCGGLRGEGGGKGGGEGPFSCAVCVDQQGDAGAGLGSTGDLYSVWGGGDEQFPMALVMPNHTAAEEAEEAEEDAYVCLACSDVFTLCKGLRCAESHFTCAGCVNQQTRVAAKRALVARGGVPCCGFLCGVLYEEQALARHCTYEVYVQYKQAREQYVQAAAERQVVERLAAERLRLAAMPKAEREALRARTHIVEEILTLKCPHCRKAFVDFEGCFALTCSCGSGFCGFCLTPCGTDAHQHVSQCPYNTTKSLWGSPDIFEEAQRGRRLHLLREYLGPMEEQQRDRALRECEGELADLGLTGDEILGDEQGTIEVELERFEERRLAVLSEAYEADREALRVHSRIVEILTLACPSCGKAFIFEGCFALCCEDEEGYGCGSGFCGFCLTLCGDGDDAQQHVAQCLYSTDPGSVNGTSMTFEEAQRRRRLRLLREYLGQMEEQQLDRALRECEAELAALGLTVPEILGDEQDPIAVLVAQLQDGTEEGKRKAARALGNLAANKDNRVYIVAAGAIPLLIALLRDGTEEGKEAAALVLHNLANNADNQVSIAAAGAIPLLIALLRDGADTGKERAAATLRNLTHSNADNNVTIAAAGAIPLLISLLRDGTEEGKETAANALSELAVNADNKIAIAGAIPLLIAQLRDGDADEISSAAHTLEMLCVDNADNQVAIAAAGAIPLLLVLLRYGDAEGRENAALALRVLIHNADNAATLKREGYKAVSHAAQYGFKPCQEILSVLDQL